MKKINVQFFATLDENIEFIKKVFFEEKLSMVLISGDFRNINQINSENLKSLKENILELNKIFWQTDVIFSVEEFKMELNYNSFINDNPNILFFTIGEHTTDYLKESWLASSKILTDVKSYNVFDSIVKRLKRKTFTGATSILKANATRKYEKNVRYTQGALEFNTNGGMVYQITENIILQLGKIK